MRTCSVDVCDRPNYVRGLCSMHYQQWQAGKPLEAWPVPATAARYCTCYGDDIPTPDLNGMCPDCLRLVEHLASA